MKLLRGASFCLVILLLGVFAVGEAAAAPSVSSIAVEPTPLAVGQPFVVRVRGTDIAGGVVTVDFRPTAAKILRFPLAAEGDAWVGNSTVPTGIRVTGSASVSVSVYVFDAADVRTTQTSKASLVGTVPDTEPPQLSIQSPANGSLVASSPIVVSGTVSTDAVEVTVNGAPATVAGTSWSASVALTEGANTVTAVAKDAAGNPASASVQVTYDRTTPALSLVSPADGGIVNSRTPTIQVAYSDGGSGIDTSTFRWVLNGVDITASATVGGQGASYTPGSPLPTGDNQISVRISDRAGNTTVQNFRFVVAVFRAFADCVPTSGQAPLTVTLRSRGEFTGGSIVRYRWDFENDGTYDTSDSVARDYTRTYTQVGTYKAKLEVQNNLGQVATDVCTITVSGSPPVALIEVTPSNGAVPLSVKFSGRAFKQGGTITKAEIDFEGDGTFDLTLEERGLPKPDAIVFYINHYTCYSGQFVFYLNGQRIGTGNPGAGCVCNTSESAYRIDDPNMLAAWFDQGGNSLRVDWNGAIGMGYCRAELLYGDTEKETMCVFDAIAGGNCARRDVCNGVRYPSGSATAAADPEGVQYEVEHLYKDEGTFNAVFRITDSEGVTATASATATAVRVGPPGSPSVLAQANPNSGRAPLAVNLNGVATDDGSIVKWEWDFEGDGTYDYSSTTSPAVSHTYVDGGVFAAALRATDNTGVSSVDTVDIAVDVQATLTIPDDTFLPSLGESGQIRTTLGGRSQIRLYLKNRAGKAVRVLAEGSRAAGTYTDNWDGTDDNGNPMPDGDYYAILEYTSGASLKVLDLTGSTGGVRYNPPRNSLSSQSTFRPYEDQHLTIDFTVNQGASEILAFVGLFNTDTRLVTLLERVPFGAGTYQIKWDGLDADGDFARAPSGDTFLFGIWGYTLPDNALYLVAAPTLKNVKVDPNFLDPSAVLAAGTANATVTFDLDKASTIELTVTRLANGRVLRRIIQSDVQPGAARQIVWDGRADNGLLVDKGDYRIALQATDASGSKSLVRYALIRVFY